MCNVLSKLWSTYSSVIQEHFFKCQEVGKSEKHIKNVPSYFILVLPVWEGLKTIINKKRRHSKM